VHFRALPARKFELAAAPLLPRCRLLAPAGMHACPGAMRHGRCQGADALQKLGSFWQTVSDPLRVSSLHCSLYATVVVPANATRTRGPMDTAPSPLSRGLAPWPWAPACAGATLPGLTRGSMPIRPPSPACAGTQLYPWLL